MLECQVCPHHCRLTVGQIGVCRTRINKGDEITSLNYGKLVSVALDPIEKKPLAHFHPGSMILSVGSFGCNFHCPFCQNFQISQVGADDITTKDVTPFELAQLALDTRERGNIGVAFTYNEPLISYEYIIDTAKIVRAQGQKTVAVTNGCVTRYTAEQVLPYLDALNIDLKSFNPEFYKKIGGNLSTVKEFIVSATTTSHVELTTLIIPGENDSEEEIEHLSQWIATVNPEIPLHISRFFPRYKMVNKEATSVRKVYALAEIARRHLKYVYTGNC